MTLDAATKEQLQQTFESAFQETGMPGAVAAVWIDYPEHVAA